MNKIQGVTTWGNTLSVTCVGYCFHRRCDNINQKRVKFGILAEMNRKITGLQVSTPCSLVDRYTDVLDGPPSLILRSGRSSDGRLKTAGYSKTFASISQIALRYILGFLNLKLVTRFSCINGIRKDELKCWSHVQQQRHFQDVTTT